MVAAKSRSAKPKKTNTVPRGRMPMKRTINLVFTKEKSIDPIKALPLILLIVVVSYLFGKSLVYDRIMDATNATSRVERLRGDLEEAVALSKSFGEVEDVYAHYTIEGMTSEELAQVDRVEVLKLVRKVLLSNAKLSTSDFSAKLAAATGTVETMRTAEPGLSQLGSFIRGSLSQLMSLQQSTSTDSTTWSLNENVLTVNITGRSLETMNDVTRMLEEEPIVDTCVITTANKSENEYIEDRVSARFVIYLKKP